MALADKKVARRYAKAIFQGTAPQYYDQVLGAIEQLAVLVSDQPVREALLSPTIAVETKSRVLQAGLAQLPEGSRRGLEKLMEIVARYNRFESIPAIAEAFRDMLLHHRRVVVVEVVTANPLDPAEREEVRRQIRAKVPDSTAHELSFQWFVRPALIAGMQIRIGDMLVDGSVEGSLQKLRRELYQTLSAHGI